MAELRWRTPPPISPLEPGEVPDFLVRLIAWLAQQEREPEIEIDANLGLGGSDVAQSMLGFEGLVTGYTPTDTTIILVAPLAGKKRIVVGMSIHSEGTTEIGVLIKKKAGVESIIISFDTSVKKDEPVISGSVTGPLTLDDVDESLELTITAGSADVSFTGSFLEVD